MTCECTTAFQVRLGREADGKEFKRYADKWGYPTFLGPSVLNRSAKNGGMFFFEVDGECVAVFLANAINSTGLALAVDPTHRAHGMFRTVMEYVRPNFVRVIDKFVPLFTRIDYRPLGEPKQGRKFKTQVMVRGELMELAGRVAQLKPECNCHETPGTHSIGNDG